MKDNSLELMLADNGDELPSNDSSNPTFASILERRFSRRDMMRTSLSAAVVGAFATAPVAAMARTGFLPPVAAGNAAFGLNPTLSFDAIPVVRSDTATVPHGYKAQALASWGTPITGSYPAFDGVNGNSGEDQEQQVGSHHDGLHYFPMAEDPNGHGILCINHEYVDQRVLHANGPTTDNNTRPQDEVRKEIAAHGVTLVEIKRTNGEWDVVRGDYNRRITAGTPCEIAGPVRGSDFVKTKHSPDGTMARGTINNCGNGHTPWDTYLACEENWAGYFVNRSPRPREQSRYGVRTSTSRYLWDTVAGDAYERFNVTPSGASATEDYRNEVNGHGWILEIDPFDPTSTPKKRTAMGRFAHEACAFATPQNGQPLAFYSGDDARNEYIYKFVTKGRWNPNRVDRDMLDHGKLYVAVFNDDGSGEWRALDFNDPAFLAAALEKGVQFTSQADVLVNTRLAADVVGATKMDRPEWGTVHPQTNEVYFALTNNNTSRTETDAANPRLPNPYGHIIRWREEGNRPWATKFEWDIFVLGGPEEDSQILPAQDGPALDENNRFASPDGLWIDQNGILWIQTDMSGNQQAGINGTNFGENGMLAANPITGEIKRFLVGPFNQETSGVVSTPDGKTLFANFQHPGDRSRPGEFTSNWPDNGAVYRHPGDAPVQVDPKGPRPRSSTIVITREDGGVVGL
ncbi:PhoX family protein [Rhodocyclaceae bacterium SMB388]